MFCVNGPLGPLLHQADLRQQSVHGAPESVGHRPQKPKGQLQVNSLSNILYFIEYFYPK
jgi:hypothetical protein